MYEILNDLSFPFLRICLPVVKYSDGADEAFIF